MPYNERVQVEWQSDGRTMELLTSLEYIDPHGVEWRAMAGDTIDGASIPRPLWSIIGPPFVGRYRRATVLHDVYCQIQNRPHPQTHAMLYDAMIEDGVSWMQAQRIYWAVRLFGPKW